MDPHEAFQSFLERLAVRLDQVVESELTELRLRDPVRWMELHDQLIKVVEPPACGTVGQQIQVVRAKFDYLVQETGKRLPKMIVLIFSYTEKHYLRNWAELEALIAQQTLGNASPATMVEELLQRPDIKTPPPR